MKVIEINTVLNGCTGRIAYGIKRTLEKNGNECVIAYGRGNRAKEGTYRISLSLDYTLHALMTRVFDTSGLHSKLVTKRFIEFLNEYDPDIIQIHNLHGYYINYPMLFEWLKARNQKTIWTLHDCWAFTGHCPYYSYIGCDKWKSGCYKCQQKHHHPSSYVFDRSKKNYIDKKNAFRGMKDMTIVTPSKWLADEVAQSFLNDYNIVVIPNGIQLECFHPTSNKFRKLNQLEKNIIILGVANLWAETKGLNYFIELAEQLPKEYKIVVVGLSKEQKANLPDNIIGINKTDDLDELVDIYSSADIFVNPTLEDNFPTTNLEALACGTPVVTFNTGGSPEAIDETCGLIVQANIEALIEACKTLGKKNMVLVNQCVKKAKNYSEEISFGKYMQLYEK